MPGRGTVGGRRGPGRPWFGAEPSRGVLGGSGPLPCAACGPGGQARGRVLRGLSESCRLRAAARGRRWTRGGAERGGLLPRLASANPPYLPAKRRSVLSCSERAGVPGTGGDRGCSRSLPLLSPLSLPALELAVWPAESVSAPAESTCDSQPAAGRPALLSGCRPAVTLGSRVRPAFAGSCGKEQWYLCVRLFSIWRMHQQRLTSEAASARLSDLLH